MTGDRTYIVSWSDGDGGPQVVKYDDHRDAAIQDFREMVDRGTYAFAICYTVRGSDERFIFEREHKARI